jgi:hypothetical protein
MTVTPKSLYGRNVGYDQGTNRLVTNGLTLVHPSYPNGSAFTLADPRTSVLYDDFLGDAINLDLYTLTEGTDSATSTAAIVSGGVGGVLRLTTGDAGTGYAADAEQLTGHLQWKAEAGGLVFQTRLKMSAITTCQAFLGFTDDATTLEIPIDSAASANTITTTATDAVGFFFDTDMTADTWWVAGVANGTDATHQNSGFAPVADTYATFRIEVGADGSAVFFYNGLQVGTKMTGAVTPTVALCPVITVSKLSVTASMTMDIDYLYVSSTRV